ncbi:3-isopropylmalate dehydratase [Pseudomonas putida]|jgi:3-isopropylmalate/(R)-2-methylmalate dehydratase small subunit|uniref:3-isopropylmalate dehydratase n=1 Tax=Pseudomonas putida TaxID=303 RepID=UPI0009821DA3|nr:3-isopropylmalate dehydratase [Pseudomonas putida]OMQ39378.1 3-isopropylmalate dehydratase [Pseudomonas putida]
MSLVNLRGRVAYVFEEENFDIDQIVGVKNIRISDAEVLAKVAMNAYDEHFAERVRPGDLLVGAANFGYGHPHYPPMIAMRKLGITAVIAESFSPGYWWGEMAEGFAQIECPGITRLVSRWDEIEVDWKELRVINLSRGTELTFKPFSASDLLVLEAGGLIPYLKLKRQCP